MAGPGSMGVGGGVQDLLAAESKRGLVSTHVTLLQESAMADDCTQREVVPRRTASHTSHSKQGWLLLVTAAQAHNTLPARKWMVCIHPHDTEDDEKSVCSHEAWEPSPHTKPTCQDSGIESTEAHANLCRPRLAWRATGTQMDTTDQHG